MKTKPFFFSSIFQFHCLSNNAQSSASSLSIILCTQWKLKELIKKKKNDANNC